MYLPSLCPFMRLPPVQFHHVGESRFFHRSCHTFTGEHYRIPTTRNAFQRRETQMIVMVMAQ